MRIRILKQSKGILDGVSLSALLPDLTYEVPVSLGAFLIGQGTAKEDVSDSIGLVIPVNEPSHAMRKGFAIPPVIDHEDDRPARKRPRRQR